MGHVPCPCSRMTPSSTRRFSPAGNSGMDMDFYGDKKDRERVVGEVNKNHSKEAEEDAMYLFQEMMSCCPGTKSKWKPKLVIRIAGQGGREGGREGGMEGGTEGGRKEGREGGGKGGREG